MNTTELRALHEAATPGPWEADTLNSEGAYGSGDDTHEGFTTTAIYDASGKVLFDALNRDAALVQEEWDEDGGRAHDLTSAGNAALIAYLRNAVPDILALIEERDRLREALKRLREERSENFNDHGLVPCPKCDSASGPHLYWWQRGQAWLAICSNCKHEAHARESHEYQARNIWNEEARAALAGEKP